MASSKVKAVEYTHESTFCENATTTGTRIKVLDARVTRMRPRITNAALQTRTNATEAPYLGPREATLELDVQLCGRGSLTSTATTNWWLADLLGAGLGGKSLPGLGTTVAAGANDADTHIFTAGGADNGQMWRTGARGDGRCEGRWGVAAESSSGTTCNSLVGFGATPNAADTVHDVDLVYPTESGQGSERFIVHYNTSGAATLLHGCVLTGLSFGAWTTGAIPTATLTYQCAYWQDYTASFPVNASAEDALCAPVMGGYVFYNTVGTTTYAAVCPHEITFNIDLGTQLKRGQCSTSAFADQSFSGFERTYARPSVTLRFPTWDAAYNTLYGADGTSTVYKHLLIASGTQAGRSVAFYFPKMFAVDPVPGHDDVDGALGVSITLMGTEGDEVANSLSRSVFRLGFA